MKQVVSSDVGSDSEEEDTKARQVLRRLQVGQYASYFAKNVYKCPFCQRKLGGTDFNYLVKHVEDFGCGKPKVGETVNLFAFRAKHKALGIHLRDLQKESPRSRGRGARNGGSARWGRSRRRKG